MQNLWLANRKYDATFFYGPAVASLALLVPYTFWGGKVVLPIYLGYLAFFELPHSYLTWASILPRNAGKAMNMELVRTATLAALAVCLLIPLSLGTDFNDWLLTAIGIFSMWHVYRQHHRICALYDEVQARRTGDLTIFDDRRAMNLFFGLAFFGGLVWACTQPVLEFSLGEDKYRFIHPVVPWEIFKLYTSVTVMTGSWAFKRAVIDRARDMKYIPWPQVLLVVSALSVSLLPFWVLPLEALPLTIVVATVFHNIQYFGFVWLYESRRTEDLPRYEALLGVPQRLVREGAWKSYTSLALGFSAGLLSIYFALPKEAGAFVIYFVAVSHYLVDAYAWRREHNGAMPRVIDRLSGIAMEPAARLRRVI